MPSSWKRSSSGSGTGAAPLESTRRLLVSRDGSKVTSIAWSIAGTAIMASMRWSAIVFHVPAGSKARPSTIVQRRCRQMFTIARDATWKSGITFRYLSPGR